MSTKPIAGGVVINPSKVFHIREEMMIDLREIAAILKTPAIRPDGSPDINQVGDVVSWSYSVVMKSGYVLSLHELDWAMLKEVWFQVTNEWAEERKAATPFLEEIKAYIQSYSPTGNRIVSTTRETGYTPPETNRCDERTEEGLRCIMTKGHSGHHVS